MRADELKRFPDLPANEDKYVLDLIGGVKTNLREDDNPLLECFFTPIITPANDTRGKPFRSRKGQICAHIAVGYLPALIVGRTFQNQRPLSRTEWMLTDVVQVEFDSTSALQTRLADLGLKTPLCSDRYADTASHIQLTQVEGRIVAPEGSATNRCVIVFPEIELIRFYLTNSSFSCRRIFSGDFQDHRIEQRIIYTKKEPISFDETTKTGRFVYRLGYNGEKDAPILGRLLFDKTGYALHAAQQVQQSIAADRINYPDVHVGFPSTHFPFKAKAKLSVRGRWLALKDNPQAQNQKTKPTKPGYAFWVHQILSCSAPFPFDSLSYCCEVAPGNTPAPDDAPIAFANRTKTDRGPAHASSEVGFSRSDERPNADSDAIEVDVEERHFEDLSEKSLKFEKLIESTHRSQPRNPRYLSNLLNASTGHGTSGDSSSARQTASSNLENPAPLSTDLETFHKIIALVREKQMSWKITFIPAGETENGKWDEKWKIRYSLFPLVSCPERISLVRQFSYVDRARRARKRLLCIEIKINRLHFYLFEAQRRDDTESEKLSILLLYRPTYERADGKDFSPMLIETVKKKTWPSVIDGLMRDFTPHERNAKSEEDIALRIISMVNRNLPKDAIAG